MNDKHHFSKDDISVNYYILININRLNLGWCYFIVVNNKYKVSTKEFYLQVSINHYYVTVIL